MEDEYAFKGRMIANWQARNKAMLDATFGAKDREKEANRRMWKHIRRRLWILAVLHWRLFW